MNKKIFSYMFYNKNIVFMIVLLILLASFFAQLTPYIQGLIVNVAVLGENKAMLLSFCVLFFIIFLLDFTGKYFMSKVTTNTGYKIAKDIRTDVFRQVMYKPYDFFQENNNGDILYRTNIYIYEIGSYLSNQITNLIYGITRFIIIFAFIFALNFQMALILALLYILIFLIIIFFSKYLNRQAKKFKDGELKRNSLIMENLAGMETFLAYNTKFEYLKNYKKVSKNYGKERGKYYKGYHIFSLLVDFMACLGTVLIYLFVFNTGLGIIDIGIVVSILTYSSKVVSPMQYIATGLANMLETNVVVNEVFEYTQSNELTEKYDIYFNNIDIKCKNLTYVNNETYVNIDNMNFEIKFGEKILMYGNSGMGKTSFTNLLCGFFRPQKGVIYFNGVNIKKLSSQAMSNMITIASDDVCIFNASIYDNVKFAKPNASNKEVKHAIKFSGLDKVVAKYKQGVNAKINGLMISQEDKEIIAFARVVLRNTPIVIIDEVARGLDEKTKKYFHKQLKKFTQDKTLIYINQDNNVDFDFTKKIPYKKL